MSDPRADADSDLRPGLILCAYDPGFGWQDQAEPPSDWSPGGARLIPLEASAPEALASALIEGLNHPDCKAALLVGPSSGSDFAIQTRAENRTLDGKDRLVPTGPGVARATAPALEMAQSLAGAGLAARVTSDSPLDPGNYLLYRLLSALPDTPEAPLIGLLRVPAGGGDAVNQAVRLAAEAIARHLSPLPHLRTGG